MISTPLSNYAFLNNHNLTFTNKAEEFGLAKPSFSNGAAYGDLDNDGDNDLVDFEYESKRRFVISIYGPYSILNLALKQKILHDKGSITVDANNVFNNENRSGTDHYLDLNQYSYTRFYTRAVIITFNFRFGSGKLTKSQSKSSSADEQHRTGN